VDPFYSNALGGAKLHVRKENFEAAYQLPNEKRNIDKEIKEDFFLRKIRSFFKSIVALVS
jgi:hypothetical protein